MGGDLTEQFYKRSQAMDVSDLNGNAIPDSLERPPYTRFTLKFRSHDRSRREVASPITTLVVAPRSITSGDSISVHLVLQYADTPDTVMVQDASTRRVIAVLALSKAGRCHWVLWQTPPRLLHDLDVLVATPTAIYKAHIQVKAVHE
jgi:hypothetical protein